MLSKLAAIFVLMAVVGLSHSYEPKEDKDYYAHPEYKFSYGVDDPHTGDHKTQYEERQGDKVKGLYTVADPDGTIRSVHYTADDHNGFNAVVSKDGKAQHPQIYGKENVHLFVAEAPVHY